MTKKEIEIESTKEELAFIRIRYQSRFRAFTVIIVGYFLSSFGVMTTRVTDEVECLGCDLYDLIGWFSFFVLMTLLFGLTVSLWRGIKKDEKRIMQLVNSMRMNYN